MRTLSQHSLNCRYVHQISAIKLSQMVFDVAPLSGMSLLENISESLTFEPMTFKPNQFTVRVYYICGSFGSNPVSGSTEYRVHKISIAVAA